jgi:hypothetical protein
MMTTTAIMIGVTEIADNSRPTFVSGKVGESENTLYLCLDQVLV